jgi:hypothetical protein
VLPGKGTFAESFGKDNDDKSKFEKNSRNGKK